MVGIKDGAYKILNSYLSNRPQFVEIETQKNLECKTEVPQGSISDPLLFNLLINDLPEYYKGAHILFVDDLIIIISDYNPNDLIINANVAIESITNYFKRNRLAINEDKYNYIILHKHNFAFEQIINRGEKCSVYQLLNILE